MVPSAYDSEAETDEEEVEEQPGPSKGSPYPIKIKWERDSDGYWKLSKFTTSTPKMKRKGVQRQTGACANPTQDHPEGAASTDEIVDDGIVRWPQKETHLVQEEQERWFSTVRREAAAKYRDTLREFFAKNGSHWTHPVGSPHIFCPETEAELFQMSRHLDHLEQQVADQSSRYSNNLDKTDQSCSAKCNRPCLVRCKNYSEDNDSGTDDKDAN